MNDHFYRRFKETRLDIQQELRAGLNVQLDKLVGQVNMFAIEPLKLVPSVVKIVSDIGLQTDNCKYFVTRPQHRSIVHTDGTNRRCALNICATYPFAGLMHWFDRPLNPCLIRKAKAGMYDLRMAWPVDEVSYDESRPRIESDTANCDEYTKGWIPDVSLKLEQPCLVRTNKWHQVDNRGNDEFRIMFTLRFKENPSFEHVAELLENAGYI